MNETENKISIGELKGQSTSSRLKDFIKEKMFVLILSVGCLIFMFKDAIQWDISDEDITILICAILITYFFTLYVLLIMGKMGLQKGKESDVFIQTMNYYAKSKNDIENIRSYLREYCILKTNEEKKLIQKEILDDENLELIKLDLYKKEDLTRKEWKVVKKARKVKVLRLQEKDLVSERGKHKKSRFGTYLGESESDFVKRNNTKNALTKLLIPIVLTYVSIESIILSDVLSGAIKVIVILFSGVFNYMINEDFAVNELRNRFVNKADSLKEFKNLHDKGYFRKNTNENK